jgi:hypothetical protein
MPPSTTTYWPVMKLSILWRDVKALQDIDPEVSVKAVRNPTHPHRLYCLSPMSENRGQETRVASAV